MDIPESHDPVELADRIDRICLKFEDALRAGMQPKLEAYLADFPASKLEVLFEELLKVELSYLPTRPSREAYCERFPQFLPVIDRHWIADDVRTPRFCEGELVGRYQVRGLLGKGAFGTVYLARDPELGRDVALKLPAESRLLTEEAINNLLSEGRLAASLDHPGIVHVYDVFQIADGTPVIVMQFVDGESLRDRLARSRMSHPQMTGILIQIADAVDYAHRAGVVHRDLEPRNILLDASGQPRVTDFGLAIHECFQHIRTGESAGSLCYMSPEQVRGESNWLDGRADIWALGVMTYELFTGRRPFAGETVEEITDQILARDPKPLRQIDSSISPEIESICLRCLSKAQQGRFCTAKDFADALRLTLHASNRLGNRAHASRWAWLAVAAVLLILIGGLVGRALSNARSPGEAHPTESSSTPPVSSEDNIELTVWGADNAFRGVANRADSTALPLRSNDKVRLRVSLARDAYCYLIWIGADGDVTPIFPWQAGDWQTADRPARVKQVQLPPATDEMWAVQPGSAGCESIVAIVATSPLPHSFDFSKMCQRIQPQLDCHTHESRWFENGGYVRSRDTSNPTRSPKVAQTEKLTDHVSANLLYLVERFRPYDVRVLALVCPISE